MDVTTSPRGPSPPAKRHHHRSPAPEHGCTNISSSNSPTSSSMRKIHLDNKSPSARRSSPKQLRSSSHHKNPTSSRQHRHQHRASLSPKSHRHQRNKDDHSPSRKCKHHHAHHHHHKTLHTSSTPHEGIQNRQSIAIPMIPFTSKHQVDDFEGGTSGDVRERPPSFLPVDYFLRRGYNMLDTHDATNLLHHKLNRKRSSSLPPHMETLLPDYNITSEKESHVHSLPRVSDWMANNEPQQSSRTTSSAVKDDGHCHSPRQTVDNHHDTPLDRATHHGSRSQQHHHHKKDATHDDLIYGQRRTQSLSSARNLKKQHVSQTIQKIKFVERGHQDDHGLDSQQQKRLQQRKRVRKQLAHAQKRHEFELQKQQQTIDTPSDHAETNTSWCTPLFNQNQIPGGIPPIQPPIKDTPQHSSSPKTHAPNHDRAELDDKCFVIVDSSIMAPISFLETCKTAPAQSLQQPRGMQRRHSIPPHSSISSSAMSSSFPLLSSHEWDVRGSVVSSNSFAQNYLVVSSSRK